MTSKRPIYLDHAAATPVRKEVLKIMQPFFADHFGNPAGLYSEGRFTRKALDDARKSIADVLGSQSDTIIFTSGGTESNNLAIPGAAGANSATGRHIITNHLEHDSVLGPIRELEKQGWSVTYIPTDKTGLVNPEKVISAITPQTVLISIMYANNEIGTINPIAEIGRRLLRYRAEHNTAAPYLHTDACQASGYLDLHVEKLHADLITLNSGKIYGPKGVGLLYIRRGVKIIPRQFGGAQESGLRAGTENVAGIVGFAAAIGLAQKERDRESGRLTKLSNYFLQKIQKNFPDAKLNGPMIGESRLPNNLNITFPGMDGEKLVLYLDNEGILCSTASACSNISDEPSHVLCGLGLSSRDAASSLRFSLGRSTTAKDIDYTIMAFKKIKNLLLS